MGAEAKAGTEVTATNLANRAETATRVVEDDYALITDGACYVANLQTYPKSRTVVITIKNVGGPR